MTAADSGARRVAGERQGAGLNLVPISVPELISFTLVVNGPFAALYLGSAWLFRKAARERRPAGA